MVRGHRKSVASKPMARKLGPRLRSEEHTSELRHSQNSYAVFCLKKKKNIESITNSVHKTCKGAHQMSVTRCTCIFISTKLVELFHFVKSHTYGTHVSKC